MQHNSVQIVEKGLTSSVILGCHCFSYGTGTENLGGYSMGT